MEIKPDCTRKLGSSHFPPILVQLTQNFSIQIQIPLVENFSIQVQELN